MANKSTFTTDEWNQLLESIMLAGVAVTAADPSGIWGTLKEGMANAGALREVWKGADSNPLIKALADEFTGSDGRSAARDELKERFSGADRDEIMGRSVDALRDVSTLLDSKAPEDAAAFKAFLKDIAQRVAEASKEGTFLGFGGEVISAAEQSALDNISSALA